MLLTLVVILVLVWSAVVGSLYSNILVFYENFTETDNYHKARYASIAATERAELVIKQREPWYVWSWWWILWELWDVEWTSQSDKIISDFSYLSNSGGIENKSTLLRKINSRTDRIPSAWKWNVDKLLSMDDSANYNMMDYDNSEIFLLYYDNSNGNPYRKIVDSDIQQSKIDEINVDIRLPWFIKDSFWPLNTTKSLSPEWKNDDVVVDRQLRWNYDNKPFTIYATQRYETLADSAIRESDINNEDINIVYGNLKWNPINWRAANTDPADTVTIISSVDDEIKELARSNHFQTILENTDNFKQKQFKLSLLNLLESQNWAWMIYPFLEYYIEFKPYLANPIILSDKYFTIQTEGNFWDYKIDNVIFKPTITESILKSFTTIL